MASCNPLRIGGLMPPRDVNDPRLPVMIPPWSPTGPIEEIDWPGNRIRINAPGIGPVWGDIPWPLADTGGAGIFPPYQIGDITTLIPKFPWQWPPEFEDVARRSLRDTHARVTAPGFSFGVVTPAIIAVPIVEVTAYDDSADEDGPDTGTFRITRGGPTDEALTVYFTLSGTATETDDYETIGGEAEIAIGNSYVDVTVTPEADESAEGTETVIMTLDEHASYIVGDDNEATVNILDDPPPCAGGAWYDTFTGSGALDAHTGETTPSGYGSHAGDWEVSGGRAVASIALNTRSYATFTPTGSPTDWTATFKAVLVNDPGGTLNATYNSFYFCIDHPDTDFLELQISSIGQISLLQWVGGVDTVLDSESFSASNGQVVQVELSRTSAGALSCISNTGASPLIATQTQHMSETEMALFAYLDGADAPTVAYPMFDDLCIIDDA